MIPLKASHILHHFSVHTQIGMLNIMKAFTAYYKNSMIRAARFKVFH